MNDNLLQPLNETRKQLTLNEKVQILLLKERGMTEAQIAHQFNRNQSTIHRIISCWRNTENIQRKHGTGVVRKTTAEQDNNIVDYAMNHRFEIIETVRNVTAPHVSNATVTRRLKERRERKYTAAKKLYLTPAMIDERFDYGLEYSNWTNDMCNTICNHIRTEQLVTRLRGTRFEAANLDTVDRSGRVTVGIHCWMSAHSLGTFTRITGNLD
ncbi:hypothetical protein B4U80_14163 [Leptotrombidium deliense]|uniref:Transposase IS30-like HTH domain-containing protein n=1 Tax=Leptotrombidium deliense TaxID=299467 RepID=A0A443S166_9ACAR|nr:hypothetical protein B4U80_14163 [Leptotrombidium deliense]